MERLEYRCYDSAGPASPGDGPSVRDQFSPRGEFSDTADRFRPGITHVRPRTPPRGEFPTVIGVADTASRLETVLRVEFVREVRRVVEVVRLDHPIADRREVARFDRREELSVE